MSTKYKTPSSARFSDRMAYDEILKEILLSPSRIYIILSAVLLDELLRGVVKNNMIQLSVGDEKALFEGTAPLATFSSKVRLSYALGLISDELRADLNALRNLRNDFVHKLTKNSVSEPRFHQVRLGLNAVKDLDEDLRRSKSGGELLSHACHNMSLFLILQTRPSWIGISSEFRLQLETLRLSSLPKKKLRDLVKPPIDPKEQSRR